MHICMYGNYSLMLSQPQAIFNSRDFLSPYDCLFHTLYLIFFPQFLHSSLSSLYVTYVHNILWEGLGLCFVLRLLLCLGFFLTSLAVHHLNNHHLLLILNLFSTRNQRLIWWLHTLTSNSVLSSLTTHS